MFRRKYDLHHSDGCDRLDVSPAVPTLAILMGQICAHADSTGRWQGRWPHRVDPLRRLWINWPRDDAVAAGFVEALDQAYRKGYDLLNDLAALGRRALEDLSNSERNYVADVNGRSGVLEIEYFLSGQEKPVKRIGPHLPDDYALPFVAGGTMLLQMEPCRLVGMELDVGHSG